MREKGGGHVKYRVSSFNTKQTMAASLKKLMRKKPLSKIKVSEIIADCASIMRSLVDRAEEMQGLSLAPPFRDFLCGFFTEAMAGTLIEWVEHRRTAQTPQQTVEYLLLVFRSAILNILNDAQAFGLSSPLSGEKK